MVDLDINYSCTFVKYGDVEKKCTKCGYVIWHNGITDDGAILKEMMESGYGYPDCKNNITNKD